MDNVVTLKAKRYDLQDLVEKIKDAIYSKTGREITVLEALGALEVVKMELFNELTAMAEEEE